MTNWFKNINYLMIEINSDCNLKCITCTREMLKAEGLRSPKQLSVEEFKKILDSFKNCPIDIIKLEGLSEPFLHSNLDQHCKIVKDYFPKANLIVITNLQYNIEKVPFINVCHFADNIYLSVDGVDETFEKIRLNARYSLFLRNLEYINQLDFHLKEKIHLNFTASESNYRELPYIYELKEKYHLKSVRINLVQNWEDNQINSNIFPDEMIEYLKSYAEDIKGAFQWDYNKCFWPYNGIVIDVDGNVRQCVLNSTMKPIGNIYTENIEELYNSHPHYQNLRSHLNQNRSCDSCKTCDYKNLSQYLNLILKKQKEPIAPRKIIAN